MHQCKISSNDKYLKYYNKSAIKFNKLYNNNYNLKNVKNLSRLTK